MITVWGRPNSINVQKVVWVLEEAGVPYERLDAGGAFGGLDTDRYGALNPNRRIPTLVDGEIVIWESQVIVRYVAAAYAGPPLWADDPAARALSDMWMDWIQTTVQPRLIPVFQQVIRTPEDQRDLALIRDNTEALKEAFAILDAQLAGRAYLTGDDFSMGDIPTGAYAWRYLALDIEKPDLPHLQAWFKRLQERPAYRDHVMLPLT